MTTRRRLVYPRGREMTPTQPLKGLGGGGLNSGSEASQRKLELQDLLHLADQLNVAERRELLDRLALKAQTADRPDRDIEMWAGAVYDALQDQLGASAGAMGGPLVIKRVVGATSSWKPVEQFMKASKLAELKVPNRLAVYRMLARMLVDYVDDLARSSRLPLTPKLVANCSGHLPGLFEASFPGYLQAGLAHMVARRLAEPA